MLKKVVAVVGARPQFIKHFAFEQEAKKFFDLRTIHTGQHYDENMSHVFFHELGMQKPDYQLQLGGGNHGQQTGLMMIEIEKILIDEMPDLLVVYGDTNSTLAGALAAAKLHIPIAHIEAGLRSYNKEMPEEINRVLTDHMSDILFVPGVLSENNLAKEGITKQVYVVGDIMKDLVLQAVENQWIKRQAGQEGRYYYATLHRPYNTDNKERLQYVLDSLNDLDIKTVFAIHPRTKNLMKQYGMVEQKYEQIIFIEPQSYFSSLGFLYHSEGLITDSGGMQKEAYWLKKKCVTIRKETEWVETLLHDANVLLFDDLSGLNHLLNTPCYRFDDTLFGEGKTSVKISEACKFFLSSKSSNV